MSSYFTQLLHKLMKFPIPHQWATSMNSLVGLFLRLDYLNRSQRSLAIFSLCLNSKPWLFWITSQCTTHMLCLLVYSLDYHLALVVLSTVFSRSIEKPLPAYWPTFALFKQVMCISPLWSLAIPNQCVNSNPWLFQVVSPRTVFVDLLIRLSFALCCTISCISDTCQFIDLDLETRQQHRPCVLYVTGV